jgi:hypothetical protein
VQQYFGELVDDKEAEVIRRVFDRVLSSVGDGSTACDTAVDAK